MKARKEKRKITAAMGADPFGAALKDAVKSALIEDGVSVVDITGKKKQNYFDAASEVAISVSEGKCDFGFLFCGTGMGVSLVANKFKGVNCALCECEETARLSRVINNANILAMGGMVVSPYMGVRMARAFLERYARSPLSRRMPLGSCPAARSSRKTRMALGTPLRRVS